MHMFSKEMQNKQRKLKEVVESMELKRKGRVKYVNVYSIIFYIHINFSHCCTNNSRKKSLIMQEKELEP